MIPALLLRAEVALGDITPAVGIIGVLAVFLGTLLFAWMVYRTAAPKTSPAGVAKLAARTSCAH
ncbi:hypothetical protein H8A95_21590 [Bradyrhizobium sp. Pear76]|uniref:hypothetical protein n=1 Tax=Bradyrhizobium oropedii TaxID=1571201 RepID=UPI001E46F076|nr:hypothetical protein [Bradyrhizobium oropedii]MCC8964838.1 hypothetical protein [Bradyrhizobium oropedii]